MPQEQIENLTEIMLKASTRGHMIRSKSQNLNKYIWLWYHFDLIERFSFSLEGIAALLNSNDIDRSTMYSCVIILRSSILDYLNLNYFGFRLINAPKKEAWDLETRLPGSVSKPFMQFLRSQNSKMFEYVSYAHKYKGISDTEYSDFIVYTLKSRAKIDLYKIEGEVDFDNLDKYFKGKDSQFRGALGIAKEIFTNPLIKKSVENDLDAYLAYSKIEHHGLYSTPMTTKPDLLWNIMESCLSLIKGMTLSMILVSPLIDNKEDVQELRTLTNEFIQAKKALSDYFNDNQGDNGN